MDQYARQGNGFLALLMFGKSPLAQMFRSARFRFPGSSCDPSGPQTEFFIHSQQSSLKSLTSFRQVPGNQPLCLFVSGKSVWKTEAGIPERLNAGVPWATVAALTTTASFTLKAARMRSFQMNSVRLAALSRSRLPFSVLVDHRPAAAERKLSSQQKSAQSGERKRLDP